MATRSPVLPQSLSPPELGPAEYAAVWLLGLAAIAAPVALGATGAWTRFSLEVLMTVSVILWACTARRGLTGRLLPLAVAGICLLQIIPLPDSLLVAVAPVSAGAWKIAHAGQPDAWGRISVDPTLTAVAICRLLLGAATLAAVADLAASQRCRRLLTGCLSVSCLVIWTLGIAFPFGRKDLMLLGFIDFKGPIESEYWRTPIASPIGTNGSGVLEWVTVGGERYQVASWVAADGFGSYICSNHFAGALCLTLPALLCVWLLFTRGRLPLVLRYGVMVMALAAAIWTVGRMADSRAGTAALMMASFAFVSLVAESRRVRLVGWIITCVIGVGLLVFLAALYGPLSRLTDMLPGSFAPGLRAMLTDGRAEAARAALRMFLASPVLGIGLGAFGELLPRFFRPDMVVYFAHNDFAQLLAETGTAGLIMGTSFGTILVRRLRGFAGGWSADRLLAGAPWAGLIGLTVHSFFDWNLHVPANVLLAILATGLAIAPDSGHSPARRSVASLTAFPANAIATIALVFACAVSCGFLLRDALTETALVRLRSAITASRIANAAAHPPTPVAALNDAITAGERIARWNSGSSQLALALGHAYLHTSAAVGPTDDGNRLRARAERWLHAARLNSAALVGLPESTPTK